MVKNGLISTTPSVTVTDYAQPLIIATPWANWSNFKNVKMVQNFFKCP